MSVSSVAPKDKEKSARKEGYCLLTKTEVRIIKQELEDLTKMQKRHKRDSNEYIQIEKWMGSLKRELTLHRTTRGHNQILAA